MPFAGNCPKKDCPPQDAEKVNGDVIRFVRNDPPTAADTRTYADDGKTGDDACAACALSVLRRLEDVPVARKAMPWFKKRLVAKATLSPAHGLIKQTGANKWHFSFWVEAGHLATIHKSFAVVAA
ncbi:MAG: hypothetical protein ACREJ3_05660 [Polyangiaceae bacterium]